MAISDDIMLSGAPAAGGPRLDDDFAEGRSFPWSRQTIRLAILFSLVVILTLGAAAAIRAKLASGGDPATTHLTTIVHPADLVVTVTEQGTLESASNVDIKSKVTGQTTIISIVKDGSMVKEGDELVRLDSSTIEDTINQQTIAFEKAKAAQIEAENDFEASKLAVREYEEGTYLHEQQVAQENVTIAMENLRSAENTFEHTQRMARKGYVTSLQRDAQEFAVSRAKLDLSIAQKAQEVLEQFTRAKTLSELKTKQGTNEAKMRSAEASFKLEEARLRRLEEQLKECVIYAPSDGSVIYANEMSWRGNQPQVIIEEGATIRERQSILKLPDLSQMQAKVAIHESKVESIKPEMRARVRSQGREFQGSVTFVANQPDPTGWFGANVKKYSTYVRIDGEPENLSPGMTAEVEILIDELKDVLSLPTQAVVEEDGEYHCWVLESGAPTRRKLEVDHEHRSLTHVEIKKGLKDGDEVALDPRPFEATTESSLVKKPEDIDVGKKFGKRGPGAPPAAAGPTTPAGGRGPRSGGAPAGPGGFKLPTFAELDKDGDKKITLDEAPDLMKANFDKADTNADGFVSPTEFSKAMAEAKSRMAAGGAGGPGGGGGGGPGGGARGPRSAN